MKYLSVCSGIEAASVAWHPLKWEAAGFSEIEPFPSAVLKHHYPDVTNFGDMTKFKEWNLESIDLLVGGTPCQSFSVAGLRKGLSDPRGNLALTYCGILDHFRPKWFVWENVPGVLSSGGGRDFGSFLGALVELGYGFAYRVLDAQNFGVAQRRRRVFVVGYLGDWRPAAEVLFESQSLRGDSAQSREKRKDIAGTFTSRARSGSWSSDVDLAAGNYMQPVAKCIITKTRHDAETENFIPTYAMQGSMIGRNDNAGLQGDGINEEVCFTQNITDRHAVAQPIPFRETADCLTAAYGTKWNGNASADNGSLFVFQPMASVAFDGYNQTLSNTSQTIRADKSDGDHVGMVMQPVAFAQNTRDEVREMAIVGALAAQPGMKQTSYIRNQMAVRRLTPVECERLQGFPDGYTNIPWRKSSESPDGSRYKALGNSMAVPVMAWIGKRIANYEQQVNSR